MSSSLFRALRCFCKGTMNNVISRDYCEKELDRLQCFTEAFLHHLPSQLQFLFHTATSYDFWLEDLDDRRLAIACVFTILFIAISSIFYLVVPAYSKWRWDQTMRNMPLTEADYERWRRKQPTCVQARWLDGRLESDRFLRIEDEVDEATSDDEDYANEMDGYGEVETMDDVEFVEYD